MAWEMVRKKELTWKSEVNCPQCGRKMELLPHYKGKLVFTCKKCRVDVIKK